MSVPRVAPRVSKGSSLEREDARYYSKIECRKPIRGGRSVVYHGEGASVVPTSLEIPLTGSATPSTSLCFHTYWGDKVSSACSEDPARTSEER